MKWPAHDWDLLLNRSVPSEFPCPAGFTIYQCKNCHATRVVLRDTRAKDIVWTHPQFGGAWKKRDVKRCTRPRMAGESETAEERHQRHIEKRLNFPRGPFKRSPLKPSEATTRVESDPDPIVCPAATAHRGRDMMTTCQAPGRDAIMHERILCQLPFLHNGPHSHTSLDGKTETAWPKRPPLRGPRRA